MMVLRFCAGPIIHKFSPLGLLAICALLAVLGLTALSKTNGAAPAMIFAAATLYAFGKTFFWPTSLGLTTEQCPKGGALTLNAMGGIGMLAVGILGFPFIGYLQESTATKQLEAKDPALYQQITVEKSYRLGAYRAIDPVKVSEAKLTETQQATLKDDAMLREQPVRRLGQNGDVPRFHVLLLPHPDFLFQIERRIPGGPDHGSKSAIECSTRGGEGGRIKTTRLPSRPSGPTGRQNPAQG